AGDRPQQRGLAATRRSKQGEKLALKDIEREMIDRRNPAEALAHGFDAQQRMRVRIGPRRKTPFRSDGRHAHSSRGAAAGARAAATPRTGSREVEPDRAKPRQR